MFIELFGSVFLLLMIMFISIIIYEQINSILIQKRLRNETDKILKDFIKQNKIRKKIIKRKKRA